MIWNLNLYKYSGTETVYKNHDAVLTVTNVTDRPLPYLSTKSK